MAAAAAKAALVAMQKKQKAKDEMAKSLKQKSNLNEAKREMLTEILSDDDKLGFLANIVTGECIDQHLLQKKQSSSVPHSTREDILSQQPFFLSKRHYKYIKKRITKEPELVIWMKAYLKSNRRMFYQMVKIADEDNSFIEEDYYTIQTINEFIWINQRICSNKWFNGGILVSIIIAGVLVGLQSYPDLQSSGMDFADIVIQVIFTLECIFKILAEGCHPLSYWLGPERNWNNFDFWLVFFCWIPFGGNVAFLRLLRLMRLLKLVGKVKQLQVIVMGLAKGLSAVSYIILLMMLIFYLFAVMGVSSFRDNDPFHFGSIGVAMLSLFRAATLEDWGDIMFINWFGCDSGYDAVLGVYDNMEERKTISSDAGTFTDLGCDNPKGQPLLSACFFVAFILIAAFVAMALFVGAVCGGMYEAIDQFKVAEEEEKVKRRARLDKDEDGEIDDDRFSLKAFRETFDAVDSDCSGQVDVDELAEAMRMLGVNLPKSAVEEMMKEVDVDNNGGLDFEEFVFIMTDGEGLPETSSSSEDNMTSSMSRTSFNNNMINKEAELQARAMFVSSHIRKAWIGEARNKFEVFEHDSKVRKLYMKVAQQAGVVCANPNFTTTITCTILAAGVVVGVQTETNSSTPLLDALDGIILAIFTIEVVVKVMAEGDRPLRYLYDAWNRFDLFIVGACFIFMLPFMPDVGSMLAMLRLLRLLRVLKLVKALPQLRVIIEALISGFGSITFVTIMLFLLFYLFANIGIIFFGTNDPMHFGNLQLAMVSLFVISTMDDWTDIMYTNMLGCDHWGYEFGSSSLGFDSKSHNYLNCTKPHARGWIAALYMVVFIVLGSLVMLNLFIGIVATAMEEAKHDQQEEAKLTQRLDEYARRLHINSKQFKLYSDVFDELDVGKEGQLDKHDLKMLIRCLSVLHFANTMIDNDTKRKSIIQNNTSSSSLSSLGENETNHQNQHQNDETINTSKSNIRRKSSIRNSLSKQLEPPSSPSSSLNSPGKPTMDMNNFNGNDFKVMNKRDIEHFIQYINPNYYGVIELPEFLVLIDFMRRVDDTPSLLLSFRESFDKAVNFDDTVLKDIVENSSFVERAVTENESNDQKKKILELQTVVKMNKKLADQYRLDLNESKKQNEFLSNENILLKEKLLLLNNNSNTNATLSPMSMSTFSTMTSKQTNSLNSNNSLNHLMTIDKNTPSDVNHEASFNGSIDEIPLMITTETIAMTASEETITKEEEVQVQLPKNNETEAIEKTGIDLENNLEGNPSCEGRLSPSSGVVEDSVPSMMEMKAVSISSLDPSDPTHHCTTSYEEEKINDNENNSSSIDNNNNNDDDDDDDGNDSIIPSIPSKSNPITPTPGTPFLEVNNNRAGKLTPLKSLNSQLKTMKPADDTNVTDIEENEL